jgi:hypothetical protein
MQAIFGTLEWGKKNACASVLAITDRVWRGRYGSLSYCNLQWSGSTSPADYPERSDRTLIAA